MRTTIDLPDDILKRAKISAVERGTTLRDLVESALKRELDLPRRQKAKSSRAVFPIFASKKPGSLELAASDISRIETEEDERRHGLDL